MIGTGNPSFQLLIQSFGSRVELTTSFALIRYINISFAIS